MDDVETMRNEIEHRALARALSMLRGSRRENHGEILTLMKIANLAALASSSSLDDAEGDE